MEYDGRWTDTTIVKDSIRVRGRAEPFPFVRELARHGVIVASDRGRNFAYAVRWSGFEPGAAAELGALALDRARSWPELRDALARWKMPATTIEYADALKAQQALVAEAADETTQEPGATPLVFAHPLGVTPAARQLFNIGPFAPSRDAGSPFALTSSPADWDRTRAMNAPGQSESPESPHFSDLAELWADGERVPLLFSDAAVRAAAPTTLILMPVR